MRKLLALLLCLLSLPAMSVGIATVQSHDEIRTAVEHYVSSQTHDLSGDVSIQVGEIDDRLSLSACPFTIETFLPPGTKLAGKTSVGVRCPRSPEQKGWSLLVPVSIKISTPQVIANKPLQQGQILGAEDLTTQTSELTQPGTLTDPAQAIGKILKYSISAGLVLRQDMLRAPYAVIQGQAVSVQVDDEGFRINSKGQALGNAAEGQPVRVKMPSGIVISGTATADGTVDIHP